MILTMRMQICKIAQTIAQNLAQNKSKQMSITIHDIAAKAGVSLSTVSRVLNGKAKKYRISPKTEETILHFAEELNYRPNKMAQGLRLKKSHTIGLVVPDISNPFFAYVTRVIQTKAYEMGYSLIVCNTNEDLSTEIEQIELMKSKVIDGFIVMPVGTDYRHLETLIRKKHPLVLLDRCFDALQTSSVVVDNYEGAYLATAYLIECGHKKIGIIQGLPDTYTNTERMRGYLDALRENNIEVKSQYIVGKDYRRESGYIETKLLLNLEERPTAIFTTSDLITLGALQAIVEDNYKIPDDISIVSFDDTDFAPFLFSPLTAVRQPKELMGEIAVKMLIDAMNGENATEKQRIILKSQLVKRASVKNFNPVPVSANSFSGNSNH